MMKIYVTIIFLFVIYKISAQSDKIIDHNCNDIKEIPVNWIDSAKSKLHIRYGRASHGTQLTSGGMTALVNYSPAYASQFNFNSTGTGGALHIEEFKEDLEHQNATWVATTEAYLSTNPECNVVMWAWCGIYEMDIDQYIADMEALIAKYGPGGTAARENPVTFVFMTAHTWPYPADGIGKWVYDANQKIRKYCEDNDRWCYDFYDLECWNPDDDYFGDGDPDRKYTGEHRLRWDCSYDLSSGGRGNWGIEWMQANPNDELTKMAADNICISCQHSEGEGSDNNSRLHCILKGNAAWWLWAKLAGWNSNNPPSVIKNIGHSKNRYSSGIESSPNPVDDKLLIRLTNNVPQASVMKIIDFAGRVLLVIPVTNEAFDIDVSELSQGIYFCYLIKQNSIIDSFKFIKTK